MRLYNYSAMYPYRSFNHGYQLGDKPVASNTWQPWNRLPADTPRGIPNGSLF